jgi:hypothetical protein
VLWPPGGVLALLKAVEAEPIDAFEKQAQEPTAIVTQRFDRFQGGWRLASTADRRFGTTRFLTVAVAN